MKHPHRLLIVEDERIVALDLERRIRKLGYDVCRVVATGADAIAAAAELKPDLVLMDVCLADDIDGIEAAAALRRADDIPVVYLTANADDRTLQRAQATLPASYLLKPFRERELQICIEMALVNHRLQRELKAAHDELEERVERRTAELAAANAALRLEMAARAEAEARFLRAQRLESIGALASGVAHDLNNVFTPLMMSAQALEDAEPGSFNAQLAEIILSSSRRGAEMVRQILLFVRGAEGERVALHADHLVNEVQKLLRDTLPRSIRLQARCAPGVPAIVADATQLHQLLMNLCVNARDAMPQGGDLTIELAGVAPGDAFYDRHPTAAGRYVRLVVADTGSGMPPEVRAQIFKPFFTTKPAGQGTGLGLSTVQSIVQAHGGFIDVESVEGCGSRFVIHFPAADEATLASDPAAVEPPGGNGELLLVADDEAAVRQIAKATLEAYGYRVLLAQDGVEAIARFARQANEVACVITDQDMPFLNGDGCIRGIRRLSADVPILLVNGSGNGGLPATLAAEKRVELLPKPFTQHQLLAAVHRCLEQATGGKL